MIHAGIRSYRSALLFYRVNILSSITVLSRGRVPVSLFPMNSLILVLQSVAIQQGKAVDRLPLAIPMTDLLSYYDSRLHADAIMLPEAILLTLKI